MTFWLHTCLKPFFKNINEKQSNFKTIFALQGECFREHKQRKTLRITLGKETYFLKRQGGIGWREVFKNCLQGKWPIFSAKTEWQAIQHLKKLPLNVPELLAYGAQGFNPVQQQSFVLMEEIKNALSLEDLAKQWQVHAPRRKVKRRLIAAVAEIVQRMHASGMNHRDLYICHFLLLEKPAAEEAKWPLLYLIDLHRAQIHPTLPFKARMKDLAALYFSSKNIGLTTHDLYYFMQIYEQNSLKRIFQEHHQLWQQVKQRGERLYREHSK